MFKFANIISIFFCLWGFRSALVTSFDRCLTFFPNILFSDIFLGGLLERSLLSEKLLLMSSSAWHLMTRRPFMKYSLMFFYSQMDFSFNIFQEPFPGIFDQIFISCGSKSNVDVGFIIKFRSLHQKWLEEESCLELTKQNRVWHINYSPIGFIYLQQMFRTIFPNIFNQLFSFDLKIFWWFNLTRVGLLTPKVTHILKYCRHWAHFKFWYFNIKFQHRTATNFSPPDLKLRISWMIM